MSTPLKPYWNWLTHYLQPQWPQVGLLTVLIFSNLGLQLVNPLILRYFIDTAISGKALPMLITTALVFLGMALLSQGALVSEAYLGELIGGTAANRLRIDLALHCLTLDLSFHHAHTPGELIERLDGDVGALSNFFSRFVIYVLGNLLLLIGILAVLTHEDWRLGLGLTGYSLVVLLVLNGLRHTAVPAWTTTREAQADLFGFLEERLFSLQVIRTNGAGASMLRRLYSLMRRVFQSEQKAQVMNALVINTTSFLFGLGSALGLGLGAFFFYTGRATLGTVYMIFYYIQLLSTPLRQITDQVQDFQQVHANLNRIQELYQVQRAIQDGPGAALPAEASAITFQDVSFSYNAGDAVLRHLSFHVPPGKVLGILGRTGSGKTTLARLLFRLYDPNQGNILIGEVDIRAARLADLRQHIGMVTQEVQLFNATVRDNLTFFDPAIPDEQILQVISEVGLQTWYRTLPNGLDTKLATGGVGLSAGQAQLLAFARVFLRNPRLIILDEASSRLDPATEQLIERAVDRLLQDRTGLIIAHHLATIQRADEILILEDGQLGEYGDRRTLMVDPLSHFYRLLQTGLGEFLV